MPHLHYARTCALPRTHADRSWTATDDHARMSGNRPVDFYGCTHTDCSYGRVGRGFMSGTPRWRDATVELSRVGVGGVHWASRTSRARCVVFWVILLQYHAVLRSTTRARTATRIHIIILCLTTADNFSVFRLRTASHMVVTLLYVWPCSYVVWVRHNSTTSNWFRFVVSCAINKNN